MLALVFVYHRRNGPVALSGRLSVTLLFPPPSNIRRLCMCGLFGDLYSVPSVRLLPLDQHHAVWQCTIFPLSFRSLLAILGLFMFIPVYIFK